jgi:Ca2+-transporting ATPase
MSVDTIAVVSESFSVASNSAQELPEQFHQLIEFSILASQTNPFDPMEKALKGLGEHYGTLTEHLHHDWTFTKEYPLSKKLMALSRVWRSSNNEDYIIATKGAPEAVIDLCHLNKVETAALLKQIEKMAADGLRVLGVAKAKIKQSALPGDQHDFEFVFLGLLGFADPVRPTVPAAIQECYKAGIRVIMITGDYPVTAQHIARQIGLKPLDKVINGAELYEMSDDELREKIKTVNMFARVVPEQKLRLVNALKENGEIVAMTGDGVNDAPALKSANIGIAMGGRGTDVAREAGALVLLDDDFSSIVKAIRLGRRIFDNLRKAMAYILAVHVPIAGLSLLPVLFGWPLVLMPVHVVFLELIIDPACSIAFEAEPEEPNVLSRPPRDRKEPLFSRRTIILSLLQGLAVLIITLALYGFALNQGQGTLEERAAMARSLAFVTLVIANLGLILSNRFWSRNIISSLRQKNTALFIIIGATLALLTLVIYVPFLHNLFRFGPLHSNDLLICLGAGAVCIIWFEFVKFISRDKPVINSVPRDS